MFQVPGHRTTPFQQMVRLTDKTGTMSHANGALNALFASPSVCHFLSRLPPTKDEFMNEVLSLFNCESKNINRLNSILATQVPTPVQLRDTEHLQDAAEWMLIFMQAISNRLESLSFAHLNKEWIELFNTNDDLPCSRAHPHILTLSTQTNKSLDRIMQEEEVEVNCPSDCAEKHAKKTSKITREQVLIIQLKQFNDAGHSSPPYELEVGEAQYQLVGSLEQDGTNITFDVEKEKTYMCNNDTQVEVTGSELYHKLGRAYMLVYQSMNQMSLSVSMAEINPDNVAEARDEGGHKGPAKVAQPKWRTQTATAAARGDWGSRRRRRRRRAASREVWWNLRAAREADAWRAHGVPCTPAGLTIPPPPPGKPKYVNTQNT